MCYRTLTVGYVFATLVCVRCKIVTVPTFAYFIMYRQNRAIMVAACHPRLPAPNLNLKIKRLVSRYLLFPPLKISHDGTVLYRDAGFGVYSCAGFGEFPLDLSAR